MPISKVDSVQWKMFMSRIWIAYLDANSSLQVYLSTMVTMVYEKFLHTGDGFHFSLEHLGRDKEENIV